MYRLLVTNVQNVFYIVSLLFIIFTEINLNGGYGAHPTSEMVNDLGELYSLTGEYKKAEACYLLSDRMVPVRHEARTYLKSSLQESELLLILPHDENRRY